MTISEDTLLDRLEDKFTVGDDCWIWTAGKDEDGYGQISMGKGKNSRAHRKIYELLVGPIPDGMTLDHLCHDPEECRGGRTCPHRACVNPGHLAPATSADNSRRRARPDPVTECPAGHEYTPENTYYDNQKPQVKRCRACSRLRAQRYYNRHKRPIDLDLQYR